MAAELVALPLTLAAQRLILSLKELQSKKQDNPTIVQEIDKFITSLHGDIDLVKKKLPMKSSSWAFGTTSRSNYPVTFGHESLVLHFFSRRQPL